MWILGEVVHLVSGRGGLGYKNTESSPFPRLLRRLPYRASMSELGIARGPFSSIFWARYRSPILN
jgi:hypothetical protein